MKSLGITQILILTTALVWIIWDIYAYYHGGNPATESATILRWATYAPGVSFLVGLLCGHFFFSMREPITWPEDLTTKDKK